MKVLLLTQYFPPEVGAPQNRLHELAVRLQKKGADITVWTAMPNYPKMEVHDEYKGKKYCYEEKEDLKIHRSWIYVSKSKSIIPRLLNYFSFVFSSLFYGAVKLKKFDVVICESPPLFLGISAYLLAKMKSAKLVFNVSDLWPESAEKLEIITNKFFLKCATVLEEFMYRHSVMVSGQTQGIVKNIQKRFPDKKTYWLPNGVDLDYYNIDSVTTSWREKNNFKEDDFILLYAGIIGHAQGLEVILKAADLLKNHHGIKFVLLGSGPEKERLTAMKQQRGLKNVIFFPVVTKKEMPAIVKAVDVAVVPLRRLELFKGAIPSKIFENLAMKKPILLGVEGEAQQLFIENGKAGLGFTPEDENSLAEKTLELYENRDRLGELGENGYQYVKEYFNRDKIAEIFWNSLKEL